ncbi:MAG: hypothetical protein ACREDF_09610 [Thermoplasmata archaeon]
MSHTNVKPTRHLFVNAAGWSFEFDPNKYFTTIAAAIAAATALSPAPDQTNPVLIYVYPGEYTEDPTIGRRGIHLSALPQARAFATRIIGTVTVDLTGGVSRDLNFVSICGIRMTRLLFSGVNAQKLYLQDVVAENGAASHTMEMTNTGVDGATPSQVIADNLTLTNFNAGAFACLFRTGGQLEIFHGFMRKTPDTGIAIDMPGAGTPGTGFVVMSNVDVDGRISVSGNSPLTYALSDVSTASAVAAAIASTSTGLIVLGSVTVGCAFATAAISVAGALVSGDITFTGTGTVISAGVYVPLVQFSPKFEYGRAVSISGAITAQDQVIRATGGGGGITLTLPTAASMNRRLLIIKKIDSGAGSVTVDASGAETIDGSLTKVLAAQYDSIVIYSNGVSWDVIGTFGTGSGGATLGFLSVAVNTALTSADVNKVVRATAGVGGITVTLPDPTLAAVIGIPIYVKKVDSAVGLVTVDNFAAETIDGATTVALASQYQTLKVVSDGTNWHII